jgi:hypothetical protein
LRQCALNLQGTITNGVPLESGNLSTPHASGESQGNNGFHLALKQINKALIVFDIKGFNFLTLNRSGFAGDSNS